MKSRILEQKLNLRSFPEYIFFISCVVYVFFASSDLRYPGLYYDEALFVNASLGGVNNDFIYQRFAGIPLFLMPYIGALKAYLYYPIFMLFGVTPESIRLPCIVVSLLTLTISFCLASIIFGKLFGSITSLFLATDPAFIYLGRLDWGPVVLMTFLKILSLFLFFKLINTNKNSSRVLLYYVLLCFTILLGLFDKLNFAWFVVAFFITSFLVYKEKIFSLYGSNKRRNKIGLLVISFLFTSMLIIAIKAFIVPVLQLNNSPEELNFNWWERCQNIYHLCISTIDGISFYNFFFGIPLDNGTNLSISTLVIQSLVVLFLCFYFFKNRSKNKLSSYYKNNSNIISFWLFNGLIIIFLFLQILTTKQAGGPHHAFMLFPFIHFLNISAILLIYRILLKETVKLDYLKKNILKIVLVIVIAILLFFQLQTTQHYYNSIATKKTFNPLWSPQIYELSKYVQNSVEKYNHIISADWGLHNQLFSLENSKARVKYLDLWPTFNDYNQSISVQKKNSLFNDFFGKKKVLVVLHSEEATIFQRSRTGWSDFRNDFVSALVIKKEKVFFDENNKAIYEIYSVTNK